MLRPIRRRLSTLHPPTRRDAISTAKACYGQVMKYSESMLVERVSELMRKKGTTQAQLGEVLGLPQQQISARLLGKTNFSVADLVAISNHFQCTPGELLAAPDVLFSEGL